MAASKESVKVFPTLKYYPNSVFNIKYYFFYMYKLHVARGAEIVKFSTCPLTSKKPKYILRRKSLVSTFCIYVFS